MKFGIKPKSWEAVQQTRDVSAEADVECGAVFLVGEGKLVSIGLWFRARDGVFATDSCGGHQPQES